VVWKGAHEFTALDLRNEIHVLFAESQFPSMRSTRRFACPQLPQKLSPQRYGISADLAPHPNRQAGTSGITVTMWQILLIARQESPNSVRLQWRIESDGLIQLSEQFH
jgi:hypothetical protein